MASSGSLHHAEAFGLTCIALADTTVAVFSEGVVAFGTNAPQRVTDAFILSACATGDGQQLLLGNDQGQVLSVDKAGRVQLRADLGGNKWIEQLAASPASGQIAAAHGRTLLLIGAPSAPPLPIEHVSAVSGISFDPKGKRVAASHYGGVTLSWVSGSSARTALEWKGAHIGLTWSPDGAFVVTAMQDCALHGWHIPNQKHMQMVGYIAKTRSLAWLDKGRWLVSSGAPSVVCWPFFHKSGPMGKSPVELPGGDSLVTRVATHPRSDIVAAGYEDGSIVLFRFADRTSLPVSGGNESSVSGLAFSRNGKQLGFTWENGDYGVLSIPGL